MRYGFFVIGHDLILRSREQRRLEGCGSVKTRQTLAEKRPRREALSI
jgi:hypothetical protein